MDFDFDSDVATEQATERPAIDLPVSQSVVFDIETGPAWTPGESIEAAKAYCQPLGIDYDLASIGEHPGEWSLDLVKYGNASKPEKRKEIEEKRHAKWKDDVAAYEKKRDGAEHAFWRQVIDNAALSPVTGKVLAIGYSHKGKLSIDAVQGEAEQLKDFWLTFEACRSASWSVLGWNIAGFDVPFILIRSAHLGVEIPRGVFARGKWLSDTFVDLMTIWGKTFDPWKQKSGNAKAKNAARFLGCQRPADEIEGREFWKFFQGDENERAKAIQYLTHDVEEEAIIARRLGVI